MTDKNTISTNRLDGWQRRLLDLTMRNVMLNLRKTKTIVELTEHDPEKIVQQLRDGRLADSVGEDKEQRVAILKKLNRESLNSFNENGTNTLYVSLGALHWREKGSRDMRIAPLLFIPLEITRRKALTFEIGMLDEDPMLNVTLLEMLRRDYGATFPELATIPMLQFESDGNEQTDQQEADREAGEDFPDWAKVFRIIGAQVDAINEHLDDGRKWSIEMQSFIGLFSFSKFLMWHDISINEEQVRDHRLLGQLNANLQIADSHRPLDIAEVENNSLVDLMLPIDYDSSQLMAVAEADRGTSFVLHGPPGTGKSQTITNIIANALFKGKRVLFVSEKKAALDVVKKRLSSIGLSPFCLELHSNKAQKRSFFNQFSLWELEMIRKPGERKDFPSGLDASIKYLRGCAKRLRELTQSIHEDRGQGLSLFELISGAGAISGETLNLTDAEMQNLSLADMSRLRELLEQLDTVEEILGRHPASSPLIGLYPGDNTIETQDNIVKALDDLQRAIVNTRKKARGILNRWFFKRTPEEILSRREEWLRLNELALLDIADDIDAKENAVARWKGAVRDLRRWHHFAGCVPALSQSAPSAFRFYLEGVPGSTAADAFAKGFYTAKARESVDRDDRLRSFSGLLHEKELKRFRDIDSFYRDMAKESLVEELHNHRRLTSLSDDESEEFSVLRRRIFNRGRGVSLRQVVNESHHVIHRLFPCMLMSPLSVAQFLDMELGLFDLVIFDEASQMETPDAIGAIARGKQTIIVGDPKQLPPTAFFTTSATGADDLSESQDADSILEDALAIGMPSLYLTRHYRSRHESLIAFSNYMFYDGGLLTFPSVNDKELKVTHINPYGVYDYGHSRTNAVEAQAVVDYVMKRLAEYGGDDHPSIGIVTFSKPQSDLIEDMLTSALMRDRGTASNLDQSGEPIFVKNLENVQGDERDIIVFSVGYGPDENGRVSLNFGPINKQGGERRLNVAVTRAKEEMVVFSSLLPEHIPVDDKTSKGVAALRAFILYSIDGSLPHVDGDATDRCDSMARQIADRLRSEGMTVATDVGRSDFRVDIAVMDPDNPEVYRLGIILDGLNYTSLPTVRDREVTVPAVLTNLGWEICRIWALDWFDNPDSVIRRIKDRVNSSSPLRASRE